MFSCSKVENHHYRILIFRNFPKIKSISICLGTLLRIRGTPPQRIHHKGCINQLVRASKVEPKVGKWTGLIVSEGHTENLLKLLRVAINFPNLRNFRERLSCLRRIQKRWEITKVLKAHVISRFWGNCGNKSLKTTKIHLLLFSWSTSRRVTLYWRTLRAFRI